MLLLGSGGAGKGILYTPTPTPDRILSTRKKEEQRGKSKQNFEFHFVCVPTYSFCIPGDALADLINGIASSSRFASMLLCSQIFKFGGNSESPDALPDC